MPRSDAIRLARRAPRALARLPRRALLTTVHAAAVLAAVELSIRWVPLPRLSRLLGVGVNLAPAHPGAEQFPLETLPERAHRQLLCTWRIADAWPFSRGPCLRRALVAGHLLRALEPSVRLGLSGSGDSLVAHAWLEIDGRPLEDVSAFDPFQRPERRVG
jgi:hypothetical protein